MRRLIEGSQAVADAVARCRPQVIAAYPISPQTHIVEGLAALVSRGDLAPCEYVNVESEFSAMSVCIGASAAGSRTYTATSSQGLLYMAEAVHNAAGLGLPIVMTLANRAIGAPINIWNDHSDAMAIRDAGWIQLFAETNQIAADQHFHAFRLAEALSVPVMVNLDGFVLTHAHEPVDVPDAATVDAFLPPFHARNVLDPADPLTLGAMVGPHAYTEVRWLMHARQMRALDLLPELDVEFAEATGRASGGLLAPYRTEDADTVVVAMGSVVGTLQELADDMRDRGHRVGVLAVRCFRPWPAAAVRAALGGARRIVVLDRSLAPGFGSVLGQDVRLALAGADAQIHELVAGLGGRPVKASSLRGALEALDAGTLPPFSLLDLDTELVARELAEA